MCFINQLRLQRYLVLILWEGNKEKGAYHLVNWKTAFLSKEDVGLSLRNLKIHNQCLLSKWLWRYTNEEKILWRNVVVSKYGEQDCRKTKEVIGPYGCGLWKSIRRQ